MNNFTESGPVQLLKLLAINNTLFLAITCFWITVGYAQKAQPSINDDGLPMHAVWRFGAFDDPDSLGFYRLAFSDDGRYLAARNWRNIVEIRDCESKELVTKIEGHKAKIQWIDFSPDNRLILTASNTNEPVKIWEVASGKLVEMIPCKAKFAKFSDGAKQDVKSSDSNSILILQQDKWEDPAKILSFSLTNSNLTEQHVFNQNEVVLPAISRSERLVFVQNRSSNRVWLSKLIDLQSGAELVLKGRTSPPQQVIFSADENWVAATYNRNASVWLWNTNDPSKEKFELKGHKQSVKSISFSADSRFLATTAWDKTVIVWDLLTREKIAVLTGHEEHVVCSAFRPNSFQLATGSTGLNDSTTILWELDGIMFAKQPKPLDAKAFEVAWRRLGATTPAIALENVHHIRYSLAETFDLVNEKLARPIIVDRSEILQWIDKLNAKTFAEREHATAQLKSFRAAAQALLKEKLKQAPSTESYYRIKKVLEHSSKRPPINAVDLRRAQRGIMALELGALASERDAEVMKLLESLAQRHPHSDVSVAASQALQRLQIHKESKLEDLDSPVKND